MNLEQAITIFAAFDTWCRIKELPKEFTEYTNIEVLEAQSLILAAIKLVNDEFPTS
jgi:hypothetical protein